jgi:ribonucleoside-diphosphate reductase alpha chain
MNSKEYFNGDELAASVWEGKYAAEGENNPDEMHKRMAKEFAKIEEKYAKSDFLVYGDRTFDPSILSKYGQTRIDTLTEERIYNLFKDFKYIVPQGSIMSMLGVDKIGSLSNCFVIGQPEDSYGGILQKDEQLVQLMKRRGGVGIDISTLRPSGTDVTNAAKTSTGAASFMERFSNSTREVAQGGRRGALMITIDVRHPDVFEFVNIKKDRTKVTGANISVMLRDDFMEAVKNDEDYMLRFPCRS